MAEIKKYLDFTGLSRYDEKIKELIKNSDDVTLSSAKAYTDEKIGSLGDGLDTVAAAILAEKDLREKADKAINDVIGVASQAESAEGAGDAVEATGLQKRLEDLEAAVGEGGGVSEQIDAKINALDVDEVGGEGKFIQSIKEENGKIVAVAVDMPEYAMESDLEALQAQVGTKAVAEVSHEATDEDVANGKATNKGDKVIDVEAVEATGLEKKVADLIEANEDNADKYAAKSYETKVDTLIGSDADKSVRTIANEELAAQLIPENAKESLDTLKEIAAWIQAHPDDASAMNEAIQALQAQVGTKGVAGVEAVEAKDATIADGVTLYDADGNEVSANAIVAGTTYYTDAEHTTVAVKGTDYTEPVAAVEAVEAVAATGIEKEIADLDASTDSRLDALEIAAGLKGDDSDKTVAERVADIENALNGADTFTAITDDEVDSLFAVAETV